MMFRQTNEEIKAKMKIEYSAMLILILTIALVSFNIIQLIMISQLIEQFKDFKENLCLIHQNVNEFVISKQELYDESILSEKHISEENVNSDLQTETEIHNKGIVKGVQIPTIPTNVKLFTDYRVYNIEGTPHYRLQNQCYTDQLGLRRFGVDYCVAVGSYYSTDIGDRFQVTLDTGFTFTVIVSDTKADYDTDEQHMYTPCVNYNGEESANLLEFIVDVESVSKEMYAYGSVDYYPHLKGSIVNMFYLGRDQSGDWTNYE